MDYIAFFVLLYLDAGTLYPVVVTGLGLEFLFREGRL